MKNKINLWGTHGTTIIGISLVLFMLGLLLTIEYHSYRLTHDAQERITYKVDLSPDVTDSLALVLKDEIAKMPVVKHVDYISKVKAAEIFTEDLGEDFVGFAGYNPLYPSLMVNFNVALLPDNSSETFDQFCEQMRKHDFVTGVAFQENVVNELREVFFKLSWFLIVVGAKSSFIARPFILRSIWYGALGGLIACVLTFITLWVFGNEFGINLIGNEHLLWYGGIGMALVLVGILISYLSTSITVHIYISRN